MVDEDAIPKDEKIKGKRIFSIPGLFRGLKLKTSDE